jgi:hypothetical protein
MQKTFTLDEKTAISRAFDAGNYAHAYESRDLDVAAMDRANMPEIERAAFVLGFFGSYTLDEIGSDRDTYDQAYWSDAGQYVVMVARYIDDRAEEYQECAE